jgi:hypothetical protein
MYCCMIMLHGMLSVDVVVRGNAQVVPGHGSGAASDSPAAPFLLAGWWRLTLGPF